MNTMQEAMPSKNSFKNTLPKVGLDQLSPSLVLEPAWSVPWAASAWCGWCPPGAHPAHLPRVGMENILSHPQKV